jgi:hypothetical protein
MAAGCFLKINQMEDSRKLEANNVVPHCGGTVLRLWLGMTFSFFVIPADFYQESKLS